MQLPRGGIRPTGRNYRGEQLRGGIILSRCGLIVLRLVERLDYGCHGGWRQARCGEIEGLSAEVFTGFDSLHDDLDHVEVACRLVALDRDGLQARVDVGGGEFCHAVASVWVDFFVV